MSAFRPLRPLRKVAAILGIGLLLAVLASLLPDNPYQRWQLLDDTIHSRARWIYERIHYDPTPIDVVFVGPSRIEAGVDAPRLAERLTQRGLPHQVVNFSLPENGRNINYAIVEDLLTAKTPKLIVIGVIEKPSRYGHNAFKYVARPGLIVDPGYVGNWKYLGDLIYLPYRQMRLFVADLFPQAIGLTKTFDGSRYRGSIVDTTGDRTMPDGTVRNGERPASLAELHRGVTKLEKGTTPPLLPARFADEEFGDERHYIRRIAALAKAKGVTLAFLALPYYTGPEAVQEQRFYERFGPLWNAHFFANDPSVFVDYAHLTASGADKLSDWLVDPIAAELSKGKR